MTHEQYLDEPWDVIEWSLHLAEARGDAPWLPQQRGGGGGGHPRAQGV